MTLKVKFAGLSDQLVVLLLRRNNLLVVESCADTKDLWIIEIKDVISIIWNDTEFKISGVL